MTNLFKGDDLVDIITVNRPIGADDLVITKCEVQVGSLLFTENNPQFPYKISILRDKSPKLDYQNPIYMRIYFNGGQTRRTCIGTLTLNANKQVVSDEQL